MPGGAGGYSCSAECRIGRGGCAWLKSARTSASVLVRREAVVVPMAVKCCGKVPLGCGGMPPIAVIGHRSSARTEHALPQNCAAVQEA